MLANPAMNPRRSITHLFPLNNVRINSEPDQIISPSLPTIAQSPLRLRRTASGTAILYQTTTFSPHLAFARNPGSFASLRTDRLQQQKTVRVARGPLASPLRRETRTKVVGSMTPAVASATVPIFSSSFADQRATDGSRRGVGRPRLAGLAFASNSTGIRCEY